MPSYVQDTFSGVHICEALPSVVQVAEAVGSALAWLRAGGRSSYPRIERAENIPGADVVCKGTPLVIHGVLTLV